jgi:transcriptional regulator with XRE-family HTH domain
MTELAIRIKAWRHALGLTQDEFARRAGIPKRTLVGYENAEREPGASALAAIAGTGVNMTWLLTGEGEMLPGEVKKPESNQIDSASLDALAGPHARRWAKIIELVESAPTSEEAEALMNEFLARARQQAELAELRQAVSNLTATLQKRA